MKKLLKYLLISLAIVLVVLALLAAAFMFWIFPNFVSSGVETTQTMEEYAAFAEVVESVSFDEDTGRLFVNNEALVFANESASQEDVYDFLEYLGAEIDDSMADVNLYRCVFPEVMSYEELTALLARIEADSNIELALANAVFEFEEDTANTDDVFTYLDAIYPNDPWRNDTWDVDAPSGENWGMEAIDAPGAWAYLDQLTSVNIGLIDTMPQISHEDLPAIDSTAIFIDANTNDINMNLYTMEADDHGTHVAGTMNAIWNNETGVSGVMGGLGNMYHAKIYYDTDGEITTKYATSETYYLALKTLIDQDVQVINISQNTSRLIGFAASHGNQDSIDYLSTYANGLELLLSDLIAQREAENKSDFVICVTAGNSNSTYYFIDDTSPCGYREAASDWETVFAAFYSNSVKGDSLDIYNNFISLMDDPAVKDRVIVVGAVERDFWASLSDETIYSYADFSNIGDRIDIVAPGVDIYSSVVDGYKYESGTSMACPHVSGVAGLVFAANPDLSGPEVKDILIASSTGRYYHGDDYSGLLNAKTAVEYALQATATPVETIVQSKTSGGLDVCFVVDTTGSMGDDIDNAKENMTEILESLGQKTEDYRVALIDYRDFSENTGNAADYPYNVQLSFTSDDNAIVSAINALDLGYGGDNEETVYSALMAAVDLNWRSDATKIIMILGDAAPLDPEPYTGYTYNDVLSALFSAGIGIDFDASDERVTESLGDSLFSVYSIGTTASADAADFFQTISDATGGFYASVDDASQVGDAIMDSIELIDLVSTQTVRADFGADMAYETIHLYADEVYLFSVETDATGTVLIDDVTAQNYTWTSNAINSSGEITVESGSRNTSASVSDTYWFAPLLLQYKENSAQIRNICLAYIFLCMLIPVLVGKIKRHLHKKNTAPVAKQPAPAPEQPTPDETPADVATPEQPATGETAPEQPATGETAPEQPAIQKSATEDPTTDDQAMDQAEEGFQCRNCGFPASVTARFCMQCGQPLHSAPAPVETPAKDC